jgi:cardiolipin synthase A/B
LIILTFYSYVILTSILLILDNRESQSTFAWLFLFITLPFFGIFWYTLFGRNWKIISKRRRLINQMIDRNLVKILNPLMKKERKEIKKIQKNYPKYQTKLLELALRNSNSLLTTRNDLQVLQSGHVKFKKLFSDLRSAKHSIHIEYYIWKEDAMTIALKNLLIQKAKEGLEIRIIYDAFGGFFLSRRYLKDLRTAGVEIYSYFNFISPLKFHTLNYRLHRKIVVIDGKIGYTGGMNLAKEYIDGGKRFPMWRDTHLRLEGDSAITLQAIFAVMWYNTTKKKLFSKKYYPLNHNIKKNLLIQHSTSGPDSKWEAVKQIFFQMINSAEKTVYIQTPYFIPDSSVIEALKTSALSGIDVRIMLTGIADKSIPYWAAFTYFEDILKAGVKIYHYKKGFMHSKTMIIDSRISTVGTTNMDIRSFRIDYQINSLIYDNKISKELTNDFFGDIKDSVEFTLKDYKDMNILIKFRNSIARLFAPVL